MNTQSSKSMNSRRGRLPPEQAVALGFKTPEISILVKAKLPNPIGIEDNPAGSMPAEETVQRVQQSEQQWSATGATGSGT